MSEKVARAHTNLSNRARVRSNAERKTTFRSVVDNPFYVQWPPTPPNVQNTILACLVDMLSGVAECHLSREQVSRRKRKRSRSSPTVNTSAKVPRISDEDGAHEGDTTTLNGTDTTDMCHHDDGTPATAAAATSESGILPSLTIGINEVTKHLEALAGSHRHTISSNSGMNTSPIAVPADKSIPSARLVVACRADVDPPALMAHIPSLVAAANTRQARFMNNGRTWLVSLPKGSEHILAEAMGLRRTSILLIEDTASQFVTLSPLLQNLPLLSAPWLNPVSCDQSVAFIPTHIKQLRTTTPKDMKSAKEGRARQRAAAKTQRKLRLGAVPKRHIITSTR
ncbi:hypothetical protein C8Q78DRAFT_1017003 [Trametes maxima]|nr:hypothetical protein C8Q78DRAFT_1017003 [Trametes maxima]